MKRYVAKTIKKVAVATLYNLQKEHCLFDNADPLELERFVLQIFLSAPAHIRMALSVLSIYVNLLGLLLFFKPVSSLSLQQTSSLIHVMDSSSIGALRAYSRFFSNLVALRALPVNPYVS